MGQSRGQMALFAAASRVRRCYAVTVVPLLLLHTVTVMAIFPSPPVLPPAFKVHIRDNATTIPARWKTNAYRQVGMKLKSGTNYRCYLPSNQYNQTESTVLSEAALPEAADRLFGSCSKYRVRGEYWQ